MLETFPIILFFYSFIPIILSKMPIIPVLFPGFAFHRCRIGHRIIETELHDQR